MPPSQQKSQKFKNYQQVDKKKASRRLVLKDFRDQIYKMFCLLTQLLKMSFIFALLCLSTHIFNYCTQIKLKIKFNPTKNLNFRMWFNINSETLIGAGPRL